MRPPTKPAEHSNGIRKPQTQLVAETQLTNSLNFFIGSTLGLEDARLLGVVVRGHTMRTRPQQAIGAEQKTTLQRAETELIPWLYKAAIGGEQMTTL